MPFIHCMCTMSHKKHAMLGVPHTSWKCQCSLKVPPGYLWLSCYISLQFVSSIWRHVYLFMSISYPWAFSYNIILFALIVLTLYTKTSDSHGLLSHSWRLLHRPVSLCLFIWMDGFVTCGLKLPHTKLLCIVCHLKKAIVCTIHL